MRSQDTQGSFITLILTFLAKVKEISDVASAGSAVASASVSLPPRADVVANLFMLRMLSIKIQKRLANEKQPSERVFRYSNSTPQAPFSVFPNEGY